MPTDETASPTYFKDLNPYEGVPEAELCVIAPNAVDTTFPRGSLLYTEHQDPKGIYVIKSGEVALSHSRDGKVTIFETLGPGGVFGNFGLLEQAPAHTAQTTRTSLLCFTPVLEFAKVVAVHPELMLRFMTRMSERILEYETRLRATGASARDRVYAELVREQTKRNSGIVASLRGAVPVRLTHEALAERTGLNRVTVTRAITTLRSEGLVRQLAEGGLEVL